MRISLIDLDISKKRTFPNLALMKLSSWHKKNGDEVFLNDLLCQPDKVYASCVFTWNMKNWEKRLPAYTLYGGTGTGLTRKLPDEIEHIKPDYSLFNSDFSLGFTSRGCPRKCPFCVVPHHWGIVKPWASIYEFWDRSHKEIILLDDNLLASPTWKDTLDTLAKEKIKVDFNQGLDIRLIDDEKLSYLIKVKVKQFRFAFDDIKYELDVRRGLKLLLNYLSPRKLSFYVLVGFSPDLEEAWERMKILKSYDVDIYPMIYKNEHGKERRLQGKLTDTILFHGARQNLRKFLRIAGRL